MALNPLNSGNLEQLALKGLIRREDIFEFCFLLPRNAAVNAFGRVCLSVCSVRTPTFESLDLET